MTVSEPRARRSAHIAGLGVWLRSVSGLFRLTTQLAAPAWTAVPAGCTDVSEVGADDHEVEAVVVASDEGRAVLRRLIDEVTPDADPGQVTPVRRTACWLSDRGDVRTDRMELVSMHIGDSVVGVLGERESRLAAGVIGRLGGTEGRVGTFAEIHGDAAESAVVTVYFASPA